MTKNLFLILTLLLTLALISCASKEERLLKQKAKVEELKDNLNNERGGKLFYASDNTRSTFTYFTLDGEIVIINEEMLVENLGNSFNLHFYDNDKIIHTEQRQMFYERKKDKLVKKNVTILIYFDYNGDVLSAEKIVNGKLEDISEDEQNNILNHSRKLYELSENNLAKKNKI